MAILGYKVRATMKRVLILSLLSSLSAATTILSQACGGRIEPGTQGVGGGGSGSATSGASGGSTSGSGVGGSGTGGSGAGGSGTGGSGVGGSGGNGPGGTGGSGPAGTCPSTCNVAAGTVYEFGSVDEVYAALVGRWQICNTLGKPFDRPSDAIGIEYAPPEPDGSRKLYYLVTGPSGPVRGSGFAYQQTYDVSPLGAGFQINTHPDSTSVRRSTFRYSPCPEQFQITLSAMMGLIVRFP